MSQLAFHSAFKQRPLRVITLAAAHLLMRVGAGLATRVTGVDCC